MPKIEDLILSDNTGEKYTFEVYPKETDFERTAGVYLFTKRTANQHGARHKILYIGEAQSLQHRHRYAHHKRADATEMGFTHICVLTTDDRKLIEKRLIKRYDPPLNLRS